MFKNLLELDRPPIRGVVEK